MPRLPGWFALIAMALIGVALAAVVCQGFGALRPAAEEAINVRATEEARKRERYPWGYYPISEESKAALCQALGLSSQDALCQPNSPVYHWQVVRKIETMFPPGRTSYAEVEAKLGRFPHDREESRQPDGTLVGIRYVYQLTNYEGACTVFQVDLTGTKVERIYASQVPGYADGPIPTYCIRGK